MAVRAADVAEARRLLANAPEDCERALAMLATHAEVIAYQIAVARSHGLDEADAVELHCRAVGLDRQTIGEAERLLRRLGYNIACDRLREVARHAHRPAKVKRDRWGPMRRWSICKT